MIVDSVVDSRIAGLIYNLIQHSLRSSKIVAIPPFGGAANLGKPKVGIGRLLSVLNGLWFTVPTEKFLGLIL